MTNEVIPFGKPPGTGPQPAVAGNDNVPPSPKTFEFNLLEDSQGDTETIELTGYLMCTGSFIGVGASDGSIIAVFPLDCIKYVIEVTDETPVS